MALCSPHPCRITSYNVCYTKLLRVDVSASLFTYQQETPDQKCKDASMLKHLTLKAGADLKTLIPDEQSTAWKNLSVRVLHKILLEQIAGVPAAGSRSRRRTPPGQQSRTDAAGTARLRYQRSAPRTHRACPAAVPRKVPL